MPNQDKAQKGWCNKPTFTISVNFNTEKFDAPKTLRNPVLHKFYERLPKNLDFVKISSEKTDSFFK